ncbi:MAG: hypothetical protein P4L90_26110 [Rhodopila sp.]|nr:hypothetical protein [Rhodopila sp.]
MPDITAANTVFLISVPLLLPVPQQLQGFATDDIFTAEDIDATDTQQGVDGILSAGMIYMPKPMDIALQADSVSISFFEAWYQGQQAAVAAYAAQATVTFTGINTSYVCTTGWLKRYKPMADAKKLLQPRKFRIEWQSITPSPVGASG